MANPPKLSAKQIRAAQLVLVRAEADAQCGGDWDEERGEELDVGCHVLTRLLNDAIAKAAGRSDD